MGGMYAEHRAVPLELREFTRSGAEMTSIRQVAEDAAGIQALRLL